MLEGKFAVITGGSRGIGRAIACKMAENGADVAVIYAGNEAAALETCKMAESMGVNANAYRCNVADFAEAKATIAQITKEMGSIDILVNNAGVTRDNLVLSMKEAEYDEVLDINLKGTFNMIKCCYGGFLKKKAGRIINIASVSGIIGNSGQANYSASKAGVIGLTKSVARELASRKICCNAIAPGFIKTDMTREFVENEELLKTIPFGCLGDPEDVAEIAVFLASDRAKYITGEVIRVDGGIGI